MFPEVVPMLMLFKNRGVRQFICSSTREEIVREYVRKIDNLVDSCFGYRPGFEKDKQIEFILRHCSLDPDQVLFVSDSLRDYDFVKDQGVRFIGIQRMFNEREFQERGLFSVQDLTALTRLWDQSEGLLQFVEKRAPVFKGR
jgi:phosphoglycolate phosphatase-like HAD superfamily hydrolase